MIRRKRKDKGEGEKIRGKEKRKGEKGEECKTKKRNVTITTK